MLKKYLLTCLAIFTLFLSFPTLALNQYAKQWIAINTQQNYGENTRWSTFFYSQLRFIDQDHPWQSVLMEGGIGYNLTTAKKIQFGYRWTGQNPYNNFHQQNRLFQQYVFQTQFSVLNYLSNRARLEEISESNNNQIGLRFREKLAIEINHQLASNTFPFFYDEVFFQLNHPNYMPHTLIGENRLFLGFNLYRSKKSWWEIGYINQYRIRTPQQTQNEMSHILSFTYNIT
jgi:hypothetical protein